MTGADLILPAVCAAWFTFSAVWPVLFRAMWYREANEVLWRRFGIPPANDEEMEVVRRPFVVLCMLASGASWFWLAYVLQRWSQ